MTRLWVSGIPIKVWADGEGVPRQLVWREVVHPVKAIIRHWRIHRGWWREPVWRDYYKVEGADGLLAEIYHDLNTDKWYLQRWYD